jgi:peptidoglycan/xylan/chitin deacetylase (PgdA/CDA1 family)
MENNLPPISISVNVDSLAEAYGFPFGFQDKTFGEVMDRLLSLAAEFEMPLTFFVVGRDLESVRNRKKILEWSSLGHEIANHSFNHRFEFASLTNRDVEYEIETTHKMIADTIGVEPKGFIAPAWNASKAVWACLLNLNYEYDTSYFPSIFLYPMAASISFNHRKNSVKAREVFRRRDYAIPLFGTKKPFLYPKGESDGKHLVVMPLPTRTRLLPPVWQTMNLILPPSFITRELKYHLRFNPAMYWLVHPADFIGPDDLDSRYDHHLPRLEFSLSLKVSSLRGIFTHLINSKRNIVTMLEHSRFLRNSI